MATIYKKRRSQDDRWVEFKCGHRGFFADGVAPDWKADKCPTCGKPGIVSEQASVAIHRALGGFGF